MSGSSSEALSLDDLARRAADGDRDALSAVVRELQHPMYRLTLRFLGDPHDAQLCDDLQQRYPELLTAG